MTTTTVAAAMTLAVAMVVACSMVGGASATYTDSSGIGNGFWRTFGFEVALPVNASEALASGDWYEMASCDDNQGIRYAQTKTGASQVHPLELL